MTTGTPMKGAHRAHRAHLPMIPMILMRGITSHPQAQAQVPMGVVLMWVGTIRHHLAMAMDSRHHTIHHQHIHHQAQVTHRLLDITGTMDRHHTTDMIRQEDLLEGGVGRQRSAEKEAASVARSLSGNGNVNVRRAAKMERWMVLISI